jgi:hypothetical protein
VSEQKTVGEKTLPDKTLNEKSWPEKSSQRTASVRFTVRHHCRDAGFSGSSCRFRGDAAGLKAILRDFLADVALW